MLYPVRQAAVRSGKTDRNLFYVACTRAMHRLTLLAVGEPSPLSPDDAPRAAA